MKTAYMTNLMEYGAVGEVSIGEHEKANSLRSDLHLKHPFAQRAEFIERRVKFYLNW